MPKPLDATLALVDDVISSFAATKRQQLAELGPTVAHLIDQAERAATGGKHLRPAFCLTGWLASGGSLDDHRAIAVAASLEWLQTSALVHDDLMDGSDTRRGQPATHRTFEQLHRDEQWQGDAERFGSSGAILTGDLALSWCDEQFRSSGFDTETLARAGAFLDAAKSEVVAGQYLDVVHQVSGAPSLDDALRVVRFKTAKYTIERPLHIGAALGGADETLIAHLSAIGLPLGEAFQLRDDVLGVFGDPARTGKPAGDDIREGKRTALIAYALDQTDEIETAELLSVLGDANATATDIDRVAQIIVSSGALTTVERLIEDRANEAQAAIDELEQPDAVDILMELLVATTRRDK